LAGAYSAPPDPLAGYKGTYLLREGGGRKDGREGQGRGEGRGGDRLLRRGRGEGRKEREVEG